MHELSITQSVVDAVCRRAAGRTVHSVRVHIGALTAVVPEAMNRRRSTRPLLCLVELHQPTGGRWRDSNPQPTD